MTQSGWVRYSPDMQSKYECDPSKSFPDARQAGPAKCRAADATKVTVDTVSHLQRLAETRLSGDPMGVRSLMSSKIRQTVDGQSRRIWSF